ncbi:MAG: hypothetical protein KCHDKBKB_00989 [Elusimicrobia bacterium]|nr:hypothetical protein [Elusimicrobiota bacterium]
MLKFILVVGALVAGVKYGCEYLLSAEFEKYADESKAQWTCQFENFLGHVHVQMSNYEKGYYRYSHAVRRCPESSLAETGAFGAARCLEGMGDRSRAVAAYEAFVEKYPASKRAKAAQKSVDILKGS